MLDSEQVLATIAEQRTRARAARKLRSEIRAARRRVGHRSIRTTPEIQARLLEAATAAGLSVNAYLNRMLRRELGLEDRED